ncbi:hypothetical protein, partial [Streptococcus pneumoniae]|uniref:hypothetical protein n=1 Tax=Streptococcus pneumoniae TaxID=1313 RepID=UPI001E4D5ED5
YGVREGNARLKAALHECREVLEPFARLLPLGGYTLPREDTTLPARFEDVQRAQVALKAQIADLESEP